MNQKTRQADSGPEGKLENRLDRHTLKRCIPQIYALLVRRGLNPGLAEEITQQTVFDAVRRIETYNQAKGAIEAWMLGIAGNNLALYMRQRAARPTLDGDIWKYLEAVDNELMPDEVLEKEQTKQLVQAAMTQLEEKHRQVLTAMYIEDLSARQIAEKMKLTEKAVHSLLYRARNCLRDKLKNLRP